VNRTLSQLAIVSAVAAVLAAAPTAASAAPPPSDRHLVLKPLFDPKTRFKPKKTVQLRFRLQDEVGASVRVEDVSFSLLGPKEPEKALAARKLKNGVFVMPFTPPGPGRYAVLAAVRGAKVGSIAPVHFGVIGVADGLIELPREADAEIKQRSKGNPRSAVR
jgi:hypothetical protein